jgi:hypothetical protein
MLKLTGLKIKITTFRDEFALQSFYSYTLPNTPFYFKLIWLGGVSDEYKKQFTNTKIVWDYGDGNYDSGESVTHFYKYPGTYKVKAYLLDIYGNSHNIEADKELTVYNAVPNAVTIGGLEGENKLIYNLNSGRRTEPLKIIRYNSWQNDEELNKKNYKIKLYANGSTSAVLSISSYYSSQWSHLRAYNGFIEQFINSDNVLIDRLIDSTQTTSVSMYAEKVNTGRLNGNWNIRLNFYSYPKENTVFCGTSGTELPNKSLFYTDQKPSLSSIDSFVTLYATFDENSIRDDIYIESNTNNIYNSINSNWSAQFLKSFFNPASSIAITSNGITFEGTKFLDTNRKELYTFDIYPIKYTNTLIPFIVTLKDVENYTTKCYDMLNLNQKTSLNLNDIKITLMEIVSSDSFKEIENYIITENNDVPKFYNSGSYFAGRLSSNQNIQNCVLSAVAYILDEKYNIPSKNNFYIMQPGSNFYRKFTKKTEYGYFLNDKKFNVVNTSSYSNVFGNISGGVCISYVPGYTVSSLSGEYVWITNADRDRVLCNDGEGNTRFEIALNRLPVLVKSKEGGFRRVIVNVNGKNFSSSPSYIATNSNGDAWVTMYDSLSTFKIDKDGGIATAVAIPPLDGVILEKNFYDNTNYLQVSAGTKGFAGENLILPTGVDVDREDNVYITYSHPLCSFVCKYSNEGVHVKTYNFNFPFTVKNILVDLSNNIWVTVNTNNSINALDSSQSQKIILREDRVYVLDQESQNISFVNISAPGDITMDIDGFVWINNRTNTLSKFFYDSDTKKIIKKDVILGTENSLNYIQDFGGIAGDLDGNLIILNNTESSILYLNSRNEKSNIKSSELPKNILPDTGLKDKIFNSYLLYKTIGDFTGIKWFLRNSKKTSNFPRYITGVSSVFSIRDLKDINIVKKNENYDLACTLKSYVLQESLFNNSKLFNEYLDSILNGDGYSLNEIGKVVYEKISNYVDNIADIDKCNLYSLKSMYKFLGEDLDIFFNTIPPSIKRVLDILSIKKCNLYGFKNNFNKSFNDNLNQNLGKKLNVKTDKFLPGYPIVILDKFTNKYRLIQNTLIKDKNVVSFEPCPLSGVNYYWGWGLVLSNKEVDYKDIEKFYDFFEYIPNTINTFYDGIIDYNDKLNSVSPYLSSYNTWTGFGGQMDNIIGTTLYRSLNLLQNKENNN